LLQRKEILEKLRAFYGSDTEDLAHAEDWIVDMWTTMDKLREEFGPLAASFIIEARGTIEEETRQTSREEDGIGSSQG
jgi:hypothetical protein